MLFVLLLSCGRVGSWTLLPTAGAPSARGEAAAVSTGDGVFVFGGWRGTPDIGCLVGASSLLDGGFYDLAAGAWSPVAPLPVSSAFTYSPSVAWIADSAAVLLPPGGGDVDGVWLWSRGSGEWEELGWRPASTPLDEAYDPASHVLLASDDELLWYAGGAGRAWRIGEGEREIPSFGRAAQKVVGVWTGAEAIWVASDNPSASPGQGAEWAGAYDPVSDRWRELAAPESLSVEARALWADGTLWIVDVGLVDGDTHWVVRWYDPDADAWGVSEPAPDEPEYPAIAWEGGGVFLRGGAGPLDDGGAPAGMYWDTAEGAWARVVESGALPALGGSAAASTPDGVFVFGGGEVCRSASAEGAIFRR